MGIYQTNQSTTSTSQAKPEIQQNTYASTSIGIFAAASLPIVLILGIIAYQKYRILTWRKCVARLEKAWLITSIK
jgi:hypothetical protein